MEDLGKLLIGLGAILLIIGALVWGLSRIPGLNLGRLPGDIVIQGEGFSCFFPIVTSVILSIVLTIAFAIISRLNGK